MNIFKSKAQKEKDKKKKDLNKKISAIGTGGGRSNQATKKRLQRQLKNLNTEKKEAPKRVGGAQANKRKNYGNNQTGGGGSTTKKTTTKTTMTGAERAKALAKKNIKKFGGQAKAAAANKEAMRLKIKKRFLASKKKKK
jgi:hypothetical protein